MATAALATASSTPSRPMFIWVNEPSGWQNAFCMSITSSARWLAVIGAHLRSRPACSQGSWRAGGPRSDFGRGLGRGKGGHGRGRRLVGSGWLDGFRRLWRLERLGRLGRLGRRQRVFGVLVLLVLGGFGARGGGYRPVVGLAELGDLGVRVVEPVGRPQPVDVPAKPLQVLLAQPVAVADAAGVAV